MKLPAPTLPKYRPPARPQHQAASEDLIYGLGLLLLISGAAGALLYYCAR